MPKNTDIFEPAITQMEEKGDPVFGPMSFSCYCHKNNLKKPERTADFLSIQSIKKLPSYLRKKNVMIIRLGRAEEGEDTQFALVQPLDLNLKSFFIEDKKIDEEIYIPSDNYRESLLFYKITHSLMPSFSETSLVSLAIDSGLLSRALNLDSHRPLPKAVKIHSTFEFKIRLHSTIEKVCNHRNGQVEIDGMFFGYRDGKEILFVLEAKVDKSKSLSLAKHKLVYSVLSISKHIPVEIPIIPVYLKIAKHDEKFSYNIVECELPDPRKKIVAIDELTIDELIPEKHTHLSLAKEHLRIKEVTQSSEFQD